MSLLRTEQLVSRWMAVAALLAVCGTGPATVAHAQDAADQPFMAGAPLDLSSNARTYGGFRFAESMAYDEARDLYVAVNAGIAQNVIPNDGYISLINPDGSAHTLKWIGVDRNGLTLNHPLGSDIINGLLYVADINVVRWFDMETGEPRGSVTVEDAQRFNDIEVAEDGTIWATQTGTEESGTWRVYRIGPDGDASVVVEGAPLARPNGVAFDPDGNIVVVNINDNAVLTFSPDGELVKTEHAVDGGNDGLVILDDGTKYVSSVQDRHRLAHPSRRGSRGRGVRHPERRLDGLRLEAEPAAHPDEQLERHHHRRSGLRQSREPPRRTPRTTPAPRAHEAEPGNRRLRLRCRPTWPHQEPAPCSRGRLLAADRSRGAAAGVRPAVGRLRLPRT